MTERPGASSASPPPVEHSGEPRMTPEETAERQARLRANLERHAAERGQTIVYTSKMPPALCEQRARRIAPRFFGLAPVVQLAADAPAQRPRERRPRAQAARSSSKSGDSGPEDGPSRPAVWTYGLLTAERCGEAIA